MSILFFIVGLAAGAAVAVAWLAPRLAAARERAEGAERAAQEKLALLASTREQIATDLKALSGDALKEATAQLAALAEAQRAAERQQAAGELSKRTEEIKRALDPVAQTLRRVEGEIRELEKERKQSQGQVSEMIRGLSDGVQTLRSETGSLVAALRRPQTRGSWGEIQLRRVVEMAGMVEHCDFVTQATVDTGDGRLRPDALVRLPAGKVVVIDSKVPLEGYLEALEATDEAVRAAELARHARQTRDHMTKLASKSYHGQFDTAPEFVVMFIPSEGIYHAALQEDPSLLEYGADQGVLIATPTTLIALLRAVHYGWKQELIAESAREIAQAGRELHRRVAKFLEPFAKLGRQLGSATNAYNEAVGSLEARVLPQLRRIEEAGAGSEKELPASAPVDQPPRIVTAPELHAGKAAEEEEVVVVDLRERPEAA